MKNNHYGLVPEDANVIEAVGRARSRPPTPPPTHKEGLWIAIVALMIAMFLLASVANPFGGNGSANPSFSTGGDTTNSEQLAAYQMTALVPTATVYYDPTPTWEPVIVVVTAIPTVNSLWPWCTDVDTGEICTLPADVLPPKATAIFLPCEEIDRTPTTHNRGCRKTNGYATNGKEATK